MLVPGDRGVVPRGAAGAERRLRAGDGPGEFRRRNFIRSDQFPYRSATGFVYDSGDYHAALDLALEMADYEGWQQKKAEPRPMAS